jgi:diguanylate cyclase (GGDEF)-like protein/PAS domain S-box-containing protein
MPDNCGAHPDDPHSLSPSTPGGPIRVLFVEDSQPDVELLALRLRKAGYELRHERVESAEGLEKALARGPWDAILSDFTIPGFGGLEALALLRKYDPNLPFIVVSGSIGEARAVEAMKAGASDYVSKDKPDRLIPVLRRELAEARVRSERRRAEERLDAERNFIGAILDTQGALVMVLDTEGRVTRVNRAFEKVTGSSATDLVGKLFWDLFLLPEAAELERARFGTLKLEDFPRDHETILLARARNSLPLRVAWTETALFDRAGKMTHVIWTGIDVTEKKRLEAQLEHDALHDALTGLANRTLFIERLEQKIRHAGRRRESPFAVLFLDLDRFKVVNDSLGHQAGDQLLREAALRLEACVRPADTVARLGGDEFAVLLEDIEDLLGATRIAGRICQSLEAPAKVGDQEIPATASVGIALSSSGYARAEDMLRDADTAMYRAKAGGRGRYEVFDETMRARAGAMLELVTDLRRAVDRGELIVHYQPIVTTRDKALAGFEALVRWKHPKRGLVMPSEFIPTAEEIGLVAAIDLWVLRESCRQLALWHRRIPRDEPPSVSVNLSSRHFSRPGLAREVEAALSAAELPSQYLKLEITESVLLETTDQARQNLRDLRTLGTDLHLDDFGTGYSSLSYLTNVPVSALKIDRSFIGSLRQTRDGEAIVRAIISLAHNLDLKVVAEGVENPEQLRHLEDLGCDYAQGFHFARPLPGPETEVLLRASL